MVVIGKNVIENLTTAMYEDLRIIYREYIQNSADSIDIAIREGLITPREAEILVDIEPGKKYIAVTDNGMGIPKDKFFERMSSVADSTKDRREDKGFRGIGRLGGISSCETLQFSSSYPGEAVMSIFTWDAKKVCDILADPSNRISAAELVEACIDCRTETCGKDEHFFKVEMINVLRSSNELLDIENVKKYLRAVAPVPYPKQFLFRTKIKEFAQKNGFRVDEYKVVVEGDELEKPYTTRIYEPAGKIKRATDEIFDVCFETFCDDDNVPYAWMWYGVSRFEKQIKSINEMRGIRLRKDNIQIGSEDIFADHGYFTEKRGALYFIGEMFVVDADLIPNARRDYFNLNERCRGFEAVTRPFFDERLKRLYNVANDYKKDVQKQSELVIKKADYNTKSQTGGFLNKEEMAKMEREIEILSVQVEKAKREMKRLDDKADGDEAMSRVFDELKKKFETKEDTKKEEKKSGGTQVVVKPPKKKKGGKDTPSNTLDGEKSEGNDPSEVDTFYGGNKDPFLVNQLPLSRKERNVVSKIYGIIADTLPPDLARSIISKIQDGLK